jgi:hypothetical protein
MFTCNNMDLILSVPCQNAPTASPGQSLHRLQVPILCQNSFHPDSTVSFKQARILLDLILDLPPANQHQHVASVL